MSDNYHVSAFGQFAPKGCADLDGYVHLSVRSAKAGNWDSESRPETAEEWRETVEISRLKTASAEVALQRWRDGQLEQRA